jgi:hypothetical protein
MSAITVADSEVGTAELCYSLGVSRASLYRSRQPEVLHEPKRPRASFTPPTNSPLPDSRLSCLTVAASVAACRPQVARVRGSFVRWGPVRAGGRDR